MKKTMFVTMMTLMLVGMIASVSAYEIDNYEVTYNKKTNEVTVNYDVVLENEMMPELGTLITDKKGNVLEEVDHGRRAIRVCSIRFPDGDIRNFDFLECTRYNETISKTFTYQLDSKIKGLGNKEAELYPLPRGSIIPAGSTIVETPLVVVK